MIRYVILISLFFVINGTVLAQDESLLSLQLPSTALETGETYTVTIRLDNVPEVWVANIEISYDPSLIYVIGTKAGSPVKQGEFFPADSSIVVRNQVQPGRITYTISMLAPAAPASGSGVVGTFQIVPLSAGSTQMLFPRAELTTLTFSGEGENRIGSDPRPVDFVSALVEMTITGETVEPPQEATATPTPTETQVSGAGGQPFTTQEATRVNITLAPTTPVAETATPAIETSTPMVTLQPPAIEDTDGDSDSTILTVAIIALIVVTVLIILLAMAWRRSRVQ